MKSKKRTSTGAELDDRGSIAAENESADGGSSSLPVRNRGVTEEQAVALREKAKKLRSRTMTEDQYIDAALVRLHLELRKNEGGGSKSTDVTGDTARILGRSNSTVMTAWNWFAKDGSLGQAPSASVRGAKKEAMAKAKDRRVERERKQKNKVTSRTSIA